MPLNPAADLLDQEIDALKQLIGSYDQKIALLEQKRD